MKTYAGNELPASRMRTMRIQLEESKAKRSSEDEEMRSYMKNLMGIMEQSIQQFRDNDRFTALSSLVKGMLLKRKTRRLKTCMRTCNIKIKTYRN
ncbi:MAG: hypothetical protein ACLTH0_00215 [Blautia producta]